MRNHYGTVLAAVLAATTVAHGAVIFVDADASAAGNGDTWATAYKYLQDALTEAGTTGEDVWVAAGTYRPDEDENNPTGTDSEFATFQLISGVGIYGGFAGNENPATFDLGDRDFAANETILSGDLNEDDEPNSEANWASHFENSNHVTRGDGTDATAILDGFTIYGGHGNSGGGMHNSGGDPTVRFCIFRRNFGDNGGGMINLAGSDPIVSNCVFEDNMALDISTQGRGGGMDNDQSMPVLTDCVFTENIAGTNGGGLNYKSAQSAGTLTRCTFTQNTVGSLSNPGFGGGVSFGSGTVNLVECDFRGNFATRGGGVYLPGSPATLTLCEFIENRARSAGSNEGNGGAVWALITDFTPGNQINFVNTLFLRNGADDKGGGVYFDDEGQTGFTPLFVACSLIENFAAGNGGGGIYFDDRGCAVKSSIVWDNSAGGSTDYEAQIKDAGLGSVSIGYSCVKNIPNPGVNGNIDADPTFLDPTGLDADALNDFWLSGGSPCVDAADSTPLPSGVTEDLADKLRRLDDPCTDDTGIGPPTYLDMGAYEFDRCVGVQGPCDPQNLGDCDGNSEIDACEIAEYPGLDQDGSGHLDDCQPFIDQDAIDITFRDQAFSGYIDPARRAATGSMSIWESIG